MRASLRAAAHGDGSPPAPLDGSCHDVSASNCDPKGPLTEAPPGGSGKYHLWGERIYPWGAFLEAIRWAFMGSIPVLTRINT